MQRLETLSQEIAEAMQLGSTVFDKVSGDDAGKYQWNHPIVSRLEFARLFAQNRDTYLGSGHLQFHQDVAYLVPNQARIAAIGVGPDGTQIHHLLQVYPDATVFGFDLDQNKLDSADHELKSLGYNPNRFKFTSGDATHKLLEVSDLNATEKVLFTIHQTREQAKALTGVEINSLGPKGLMIVSDFIVGDWDVVPTPGYEDNPEVQALLTQSKRWIWGDKNPDSPFKGVVDAAWGRRGAHPWTSPDQIVEAFSQYSDNRLKIIYDNSGLEQQTRFSFGDPIREIANALVPTTVRAYGAGLRRASVINQWDINSPQFQGALAEERALWEGGAQFIKAMDHPGIDLVMPRMWRGVFQVE